VVQTPTSTSSSGLAERYSFCAYFGCSTLRLRIGKPRLDGFQRLDHFLGAPQDHTGLPRHSITASSPGGMRDTSISTGAPAARARSEGHMLAGRARQHRRSPPPTTDVATTDCAASCRLFLARSWRWNSSRRAQKHAILAMRLCLVHDFACKRLVFKGFCILGALPWLGSGSSFRRPRRLRSPCCSSSARSARMAAGALGCGSAFNQARRQCGIDVARGLVQRSRAARDAFGR